MQVLGQPTSRVPVAAGRTGAAQGPNSDIITLQATGFEPNNVLIKALIPELSYPPPEI